jgi:putative DNA primase/helicase
MQKVTVMPAALSKPAKSKKLPVSGFPHQPRPGSELIKATLENVEHMLMKYQIQARYNEISKRSEVQLPDGMLHSANADNVAITKVVSLATLNNMPTTNIPQMLDSLAETSPVNPAKEWILGKPWDGKCRLDPFYDTIKTPTTYSHYLKLILMRKWLLSATAAALMPNGFYTRGVLTLQGAQNKGKTNWVRSLVNDPVLQAKLIKIDHHLDANNKDSVLGATSYWLVELGELDSSFKKDIARIKGFLSSDRDRVRRPYARFESDFQRRTVFCATVNEPTFLVDPTGNTRWWTIEVEDINFNHGIDMQQLFAQMAVEFEKGEQWWLNDDENALLEDCNLKFRAVSKIRDKINQFLDTTRVPSSADRSFTATSLLEEFGIKNPTNNECRECGSILRELFGAAHIPAGAKAWRVPLKQGPNECEFQAAIKDMEFDDLY